MKTFWKQLLINVCILVVIPAAAYIIGHSVTRGGYSDAVFEATSMFIYLAAAVCITFILYGKEFRDGEGRHQN